jgi:hypothetical protein
MNTGYTLYEFDMFTPPEEIREALEEMRAVENKSPQVHSLIQYLEKLLKSAEAEQARSAA